MLLTMLKAKTHRAKITKANLNYVGSITIGLLCCLLLFGNAVIAMEEEDDYGKKAVLAVKAVKDSNKISKGLNEELAEKGDEKVGDDKIEELAFENPELARKLNDALIERGDEEAIWRKMIALERGGVCSVPGGEPPSTYGYGRDLIAARELNDALVERCNQEAIQRKIMALQCGGDWYDDYHCYHTHGYTKNIKAAEDFKEFIKTKSALSQVLECTGLPRDLLRVILEFLLAYI